ncbi:ABC transporter ATP-binding protein [Clostridium sp. UBA1056]|uniref:ABC transporter ATP-binding protein n=1 Tax=unclassified Clostridium TaxID=2614128 RepID=UPI0032161EDB
MENILTVENLKKYYGKNGSKYEVLKGVSFKIEKGEFVGIMGASGAGKSTLLNIISTIDTQSSGKVIINNINLSKLSEDEIADFRRDNLGFVFQNSNLLDTLTIKENIMLPMSLKNEKVSIIEKRVEEVADALDIKAILNKYPYEISGGQKQRGAVCRAIVTNPALILADEPTGALDSRAARNLLETFSKLNTERKSTILMVTHDPTSASFCNRILFIKDGIIFAELVKGESNRKFYYKILDTVALLGGCDRNELI